MKRIIHIILFSIFVIVIAALMTYIYLEHRKKQISGIEIAVLGPAKKGFISHQDIMSSIDPQDSLTTYSIKDIPLAALEAAIMKNPFAKHADAFINVKGKLIIHVKEAVPILRVYTKTGESFYVDEEGYLIPLSKQHTPKLTVFNGYIMAKYDGEKGLHVSDSRLVESHLLAVYELALLLRKRAFLNAQISQIYLNSKQEIDMIPLVGKHIIQLGALTGLNEKLTNLEAFYQKTLADEGWENYKTINLKYKNQIVCTKK